MNPATAALLELEGAAIPTLIAQLYEAADVARPTEQRPIVPLRRLILGQAINQQEIPNLSERTAMYFLLRQGGLREAWLEPSGEALAGFLYANTGGACLFVKREDPVARRRFSAAHELGHYLLHFPRVLAEAVRRGYEEVELIEVLPPATNPDADEISNGNLRVPSGATLPDPAKMELEADRFAAELLMPADVVTALATPYLPHCSGSDIARRLATEMLVSRAALLVRLRHLGLLRGENAAMN